MMPKRLYYLHDYADEVMPCRPELAAWAEWLSKPDVDWGHEIPPDGTTFKCETMDLLGDVHAEHDGDGWKCAPRVPEGADWIFVRWGEGMGWDPEASGPDIATALTDVYPDEAEAWLACTRAGPSLIVRYRADPPRLEIIEGQA